MWPRCDRDVAEMSPRCALDRVEIRLRCRRADLTLLSTWRRYVETPMVYASSLKSFCIVLVCPQHPAIKALAKEVSNLKEKQAERKTLRIHKQQLWRTASSLKAKLFRSSKRTSRGEAIQFSAA